MSIQYVIGDATHPQGDGVKIIAHVCNNVGAWGAGFTGALSKRWGKLEDYYRMIYDADRKMKTDNPEHKRIVCLGEIILMPAEKDIWVANMVAQDGIGTDRRRIRYDALRKCLSKIPKALAWQEPHVAFTVHMPRIGCGLAGGEWSVVEQIINEELVSQGVSVTVYDLEKK